MATKAEADRHRRAAQRCRQLARQMTDAGMQAQLAEIADTYEKLARQIERYLAGEPP